MTYPVRWLTSQDVDGRVYQSVHGVVESVMRGGGAIGFRGVPTMVETETWLDAILRREAEGNARFAVIVRAAEGEDWRKAEVVALGRWERYEGPLIAGNADIRQVMVHPSARGEGLARLLVQHLVADAQGAGVETLTLDVRGNNHAAMALYESLGFLVSGRIPDFVAVGEQRFDRVSYRLDLRTAAFSGRRVGGLAFGPGEAPLGKGRDG